MAEEKDSWRATRILIIAAALVIIISGVNQAQSVLMSFLIAVFLAVIGTPPLYWLRKKGIPSVVSVLIVVAGMAAVLVVIGLIVGTSLNSFSANIPRYQALLREEVLSLQQFLAVKGIRISDPLLFDQVNPGVVMSMTANVVAALGRALFETVMILLILTFILLEAPGFPAKVRAILGDPRRDFVPCARFVQEINRYLVIKTAVSLIAGLSIGIWLYALGVPYPALWGFLAFLFHYVPNIGALIAAVPAVLLTLIQFGAGRATLAASGYVAVNIIFGNILEPRLMGRKLGLSTLAVFLSLIFWGSILGLIGFVLAIPFTMALKFAAEGSESTRWIAILLGPELSPEQVSQTADEEKSRRL